MDIRAKILLACRDLALTKGFYNLNMDELSRQAGVSKRTVYRYFRSKEEIIGATLDVFMAHMQDAMDSIAATQDTPPDMIAAVMKEIFSHGRFIFNPVTLNDLRVHYPHLWQRIDDFRSERARVMLSTYIERSENRSLQEIDPRILAAVLLASIQAVLNPEFILENNLTFESAANQLSKFLIACLT
ncbi:Tetracycline transcriptional regulator, TetR-related, C-terminal [Syntrophomonas zehnderi OL-4]|uniref:Tetracycline transcriptional regulator, TetR-related, C-terminal n=1 Tax=Syntrophomonas zehnderi OL-4 TaxID=690567 RepID=A0A0E4C7H4_9FIRM|nr:TetR/AcrR family transcriptional regulator [Syntrophomonas zehnderi]CFX01701.1 Tetracycline transcriptional regulator, TetR-related, C-terminal [Syntrophomonas zehnderi OL-4]